MKPSRLGGFLSTLVFTTVGVILAVVAVITIGGKLFDNPFRAEIVDRSPPPVLASLQDLAEFHAARGNFEVIVDLEKDVKNIPSVLAGERVVFVGVGSVDAYVDFTALDETAIAMNDERTQVTITIPAPVLSDPVVDPELSHVVDSDKGLFDRIGDLVSGDDRSDQALYVAAADKIGDAAASTELRAIAEENTRKLLDGLLSGLGFEQVEVVFAAPIVTSG